MSLYDKINPNEPKQTEAERFKPENEKENLTRQQQDAEARRAIVPTKEEHEQPAEQKDFDNTNPSLETEVQNETPALEMSNDEGMEHSWQTGLEYGSTMDRLTEQIGQSIVDKFTSKEQQHDKNEDEKDKNEVAHDKWEALANEFSPESASYDDKSPDKDIELDER